LVQSAKLHKNLELPMRGQKYSGIQFFRGCYALILRISRNFAILKQTT